MATYLYADPHFCHAAIIGLASRPFVNVGDMNNALIGAWRRTVKPSDQVIVVGDFAHRADPAEIKRIFAALPGEKHLIVGNHDDAETLSLPWKSIRDVAYVSIDSQRVVLCHYAWRTWPGIRKGALMLYGHNHGKLPGNRQSCDVGVDVFGLAPVRLATVKAYLATLPIAADPEADLPDMGI